MEIKSFLKEAAYLILYSLYPIYILYINFIFIGLFILDNKVFSDVTVLVFFVIFNILQTFTMIYYILIFTSDTKSTQDIFPMATDSKEKREYSNLNPFIAQTLEQKSIEKTLCCEVCQTYKPPRCHHCSKCNKCFLKMDHHCIFLDVCIGFHNYKYFIQFLFSNVLLITFFVAVITVDTSKSKLKVTEILVNFIISIAFSIIGLVLIGMTLRHHLFLISNNETTIENLAINQYLEGNHAFSHVFQEGPISKLVVLNDRKKLNPYNLGYKNNWKEVFGEKAIDWILPSFSSLGDGITFKKNTEEDDDD